MFSDINSNPAAMLCGLRSRHDPQQQLRLGSDHGFTYNRLLLRCSTSLSLSSVHHALMHWWLLKQAGPSVTFSALCGMMASCGFSHLCQASEGGPVGGMAVFRFLSSSSWAVLAGGRRDPVCLWPSHAVGLRACNTRHGRIQISVFFLWCCTGWI